MSIATVATQLGRNHMDQPASPVAMTGWVTLGNGEQRELAGMGSRLGARIIDFILLAVASVIVLIILFGGLARTERGFFAAFFLSLLVISAIVLLYEVTMIAVLGQTLGKKWAGVKVVHADHGGVPGWGKSIIRWLIPGLVNIIPVIGNIAVLVVFLSPLFSKTRQGWHDMAATTVVVKS